jgi:hypothetical protein
MLLRLDAVLLYHHRPAAHQVTPDQYCHTC